MKRGKIINYQSSVISCQMLVKLFVIIFTFLLITVNSFSQVGVGINSTGAQADNSAILDVSSTTQGTLITRMNTTQRNAIVSPANSLLIFNTTSNCFEAWNQATLSWVAFGCLGCPIPTQPSAITGTGTVCQNQNGVAYSVTNVSGVAYSWTYSGTGFTIASGSGTNSITANFSASATSGTLSVTGSNSCGSSSAQTLVITVNPLPVAPAAVTNTATQTTITWNWNTVSNATGYQWNITPAYPGVGVNVVASTSYTQGSLICGSSYSLYVWAYNSCGHSSAYTTLTQNTSSCCNISCVGGIGNINTIAGNGTGGFTGDGGAATSAEINISWAVAVDASGNVYFVDAFNYRIRKVTLATGIISTIAGNGTSAYSGDGGQATAASLYYPQGVAVDGSGNVYIADESDNRIRKVTAATGIITTIAGSSLTGGFSGDGGQATAAQLNQPWGVAVDASGNVYFADWSNQRIRMITVSTGIITTIAGTGTAGFSGDGGVASNAQLNNPVGVAVDGSGNVFIADQSNQRIRKVTGGIISTIAGNGVNGYGGDGGAATSASLKYPLEIAVDNSGNLYIADSGNNRIRMITVSTGIISTFAGNGTSGYSGDGGAATSAKLSNPNGVAVSCSGVYISDEFNNRIREVCK